MSAIASVEIEGEDFGTMELKDEFRRGELVPAHGQAYFCQSCGRIWAKVTVTGRPYFPWSLSCEKCGNAHSLEIAGSLWLIWDRDFNNALSLRVLEREARLALKHWDGQEMEAA